MPAPGPAPRRRGRSAAPCGRRARTPARPSRARGGPSRTPRPGRPPGAASASPSAAGSLGGTICPSTPGSISSGTPPSAVPTTGSPDANASRTASGMFSYQRDGTAATLADRSSSCSASVGRRPWKRMRSAAPRSFASDSSDARDGPSPATSSRRSARAATASTNTSTPFSSESRPANTTSPPGSCFGVNASRSTKLGIHRSRSGNTLPCRILPSRNWLGHAKMPTGAYARPNVCSVISTAFRALAAAEPPLQRRTTGSQKRWGRQRSQISP